MTNTPSAAAPTEQQLLDEIERFWASGARRVTSGDLYKRLMPLQAAATLPGVVDHHLPTIVIMLRKLTNEGRINTTEEPNGTLTVRFAVDLAL